MKTLKFLLPVIALASPLILQAQPQPPQPEEGGPPPEFRHRDRDFPKLPEDVRKRFFEAREKALKDPKIADLKEKASEANKAFFTAMKAKMTEIDPGLDEILDKARKDGPGEWKGKGKGDKPEGKKGDGPRRDDGPGKRGGHKGPDLSKLTEEERTKFLAARDKAKEDPSVQEAKKKLDDAKTPEERQAARQSFGEAMREATLKADPSLASVLDKIKRPSPPAPDDKTPAPPGTEPMTQP